MNIYRYPKDYKMFFISDEKSDKNVDVCKILNDEFSKYLIVKQKQASIKVLSNTENNNTTYNTNSFKVKVKSKTIKSQEWHHS